MGQYRKFIEKTKYVETDRATGNQGPVQLDCTPSPNRTREQRAVIGVSWDDAKAFCKWLSKEEEVTYDLPSEAQWEFACRAGTTTAWSFGDEAAGLAEHGIHGRPSFWPAEVVGSKAANPFGLFDMHGNADEWCLDWHHRDFYANCPLEDPVNLKEPQDKSSGRVARGGAPFRPLGGPVPPRGPTTSQRPPTIPRDFAWRSSATRSWRSSKLAKLRLRNCPLVLTALCPAAKHFPPRQLPHLAPSKPENIKCVGPHAGNQRPKRPTRWA